MCTIYRKNVRSFTFELYFSNEFLWIILAIIFKAQYYFPRNLFIIFKSSDKKPEITLEQLDAQRNAHVSVVTMIFKACYDERTEKKY